MNDVRVYLMEMNKQFYNPTKEDLILKKYTKR